MSRARKPSSSEIRKPVRRQDHDDGAQPLKLGTALAAGKHDTNLSGV